MTNRHPAYVLHTTAHNSQLLWASFLTVKQFFVICRF